MKGFEEQEKTDDSDRCVSATVRTVNGGAGALRRPFSLLDRLRLCQDAWAPGVLWDREEAHAALWGRPAGSFLVLKDSTAHPFLLCVSAGADSGPVTDYPIKHTGAAYQLSHSHLGFSDLVQLVVFYSLSRDVLSVCLFIPLWFYSLTDQPESHLSQLGPKSWLCPTSDPQPDQMTQSGPGTAMCTIQLTSVNGALCIINPLYLHEHADDWLTHQPTSPQRATRPANYRRERRLSTTRPWGGAGLLHKRTISLEQEPCSANSDSSGSTIVQAVQSAPSTSTPMEGVVLRRPSRDAATDPLMRTGSQGHTSTPGSPNTPSETRPLFSPIPHRVSWIEDGVWLSPPPSMLHPPSLELDSLSISSMEEEPESVTSPAHSYPQHRLADKVKHRLSAVGQAIGGLVCPQKRLTNRVQELSERRGGVFAEAVKGFVDQTLRGRVDTGVTGAEFLQDVRVALTALREMLLDCPEVHILIDSMNDTPEWELDIMLEICLHKVALKPITTHLYACLQSCRCHDGSLQCLRDNQRMLEGRGVEELDGTIGAGVPDPPNLERIQQRWAAMHRAYSPSKKVQGLLKVCKSIYHSMNANASPGVVYGADDFLPCLTWVILRSDVVTLQLDTDYMMELLDPIQLQGEGGYYLTSVYASLFYISSFRPRLATRQLSAEAQQSLSQWHRRRTLHCKKSRSSRQRRSGYGERSAESSADAGKTVVDKETETNIGNVVDSTQLTPWGGAESMYLVTEGLTVVREEEGSGVDGQLDSPAVFQRSPPQKEVESPLDEDRTPTGSAEDYGRESIEGSTQRIMEGGITEALTEAEGAEGKGEGRQTSLYRVHYEALWTTRETNT